MIVRPRRAAIRAAPLLCLLWLGGSAAASTYVVMIPLQSPIYDELETLDGLGYLDTYFSEIRPFSRVEAARLALEAERNMRMDERVDPIAARIVKILDEQLAEEIGWLRSNAEDNPPTMLHPLENVQAQYVFSEGARRHWLTGGKGPINAQEGTPLLPNNDGLPTAPGGNEILRASGWVGLAGFITGYAEGAVAGPLTRGIDGTSRGQLLGTEAVVSLGNTAISFGQQERWWGTGHFGSLSQGDNAKPFYALTVQNIHPRYLPWILRYLGPGKRQIFMGQLDADRPRSQHPWIVGHIVAFKPLPWFEFGMTRAIIFGGRDNDRYGFGGFLGRFTGIATGNPVNGNTKSRGGIFLKLHLPRLRNLQLYQEIAGSDNLTNEVPTIGHYMPFLNVAYQGGAYLPRLTEDGLTDCRIEWVVTPGGYDIQMNNSLYFTYDDLFFGHPIGPNATQVDVQFGLWFGLRQKASVDFFYTEQAPSLYEGNTHFYYAPHSVFYPYASLGKEHSEGIALDLMRLAEKARLVNGEGLMDGRARAALEYVQRLNYGAPNSVRALVSVSIGITPTLKSFELR